MLTFDIVVLPMPEALVGTFKGDLTDAAQAVVGSVTLKVTDAGSLSAKVKYGRKSVNFTAKGFVVSEGYDALLEKKNTGTVRIVIGRDAAGNPDGTYAGVVEGEKFGNERLTFELQ